MGLIKTAIMTGGGIYAANKIAKSIQQNHSTNNQNSSRDNPYPQQNNYYPRPAPHQGPRAVRDESFSEMPTERDQRDYYAYDSNSRRENDPNRDYSIASRSGMKPAKSSGFTFPEGEEDIYSGRYIQPAEYPYQPASNMAQRSENPPTYSPHPEYVQPRPNAGEQRQRYDEQQQQQMSRAQSPLDMAAGMAMDFVRNGGNDGKKYKGKKGRDMFSELLK